MLPMALPHPVNCFQAGQYTNTAPFWFINSKQWRPVTKQRLDAVRFRLIKSSIVLATVSRLLFKSCADRRMNPTDVPRGNLYFSYVFINFLNTFLNAFYAYNTSLYDVVKGCRFLIKMTPHSEISFIIHPRSCLVGQALTNHMS